MSESVFDALNAGAVDFVTKPDYKNGIKMESLINELIVKIKIASTAQLGHWKNQAAASGIKARSRTVSMNMVIAIGASTGGTEALFTILNCCPKTCRGLL